MKQYTSPDKTQETLSKDQQHQVVKQLLEQGKGFQNFCEVTENKDGTYHIVIESFVFVLKDGQIDSEAEFVPYTLELDVENIPISFYYDKPTANPKGPETIEFTWDEKAREPNSRTVLPVAKIIAPHGCRLARPGHLYYKGTGRDIGVKEAIIAVMIEDGKVTIKDRYFPIDCAPELFLNATEMRTLGLDEINQKVGQVTIETAKQVQYLQNPLS